MIIIKVITKLPNSEQSYKGKLKTHNYINRQNQSTTENCENRNDPDFGTALTTILPILFLYLNTVTVTAGTFEP
jgi:H+/gluconate symporter-like permease